MKNVFQFVVCDVNGKEIDWIDPVVTYEEVAENTFDVDNGFNVYTIRIPEGGSYSVGLRKD